MDADETRIRTFVERRLARSRAENGRLRTTSDIDPAIEGGALADALRVTETSRFRVDVSVLETQRPAVARCVREEGKPLYETQRD